MPGYWLAMNTNNSTEVLPGVQTVEPVFGLDAVWITEVERKNAEVAGYTVVDAASVLVTHFSEDDQALLSPDSFAAGCSSVAGQHEGAEPRAHKRTGARFVVGGAGAAGAAKSPQRGSADPKFGGHPRAGERLRGHDEESRRVGGAGEARNRWSDCEIVPGRIGHDARDHAWIRGWRRSWPRGCGHRRPDTVLLIDPKMAEHLSHHFNTAMQPMIAEGRSPVVICSALIRAGLRRFFAAKFSELAFPLLRGAAAQGGNFTRWHSARPGLNLNPGAWT